MPRPSRSLAARLLIALFAVIVASPLASLAMRCATVAHAITGKCTGDCSICGCSPERSATRTCCCWKKRLQEEEARKPDCCKKKSGHSKATVSWNYPCGSDRLISVAGAGKFALVPYQFSGFSSPLLKGGNNPLPPAFLTDYNCEPPDPPPKTASFS